MPKTPNYFHSKCIIITGAAKGIGAAAARIFGREGANVLCADIELDTAKTVAEEVMAAGGHGIALRTDVTSRDDVQAMVDEAKRSFGRVDFLLNSAGSNIRRTDFVDLDDDTLDKVIDLNIKGTIYATQAALPVMIGQGAGVIVNLGSMAHMNGGPGGSIHYAMTKGAVVTLSRGVAREYADRGIRCLSISPGYIDTPFQADLPPQRRKALEENVPLKRFGRPEEIGELVLFMCSDACEYMTADTLFVNGGGGFR